MRELLPNERFSYVADTAHFPYGERTTEELTEIIHSQMERVIARLDPKLAVVACNTASVVALADLRAAFGIPFVGVVPAIKPAAEHTVNGVIGLLATRKTVEDPYTRNLEQQFAADTRVCRFAGVEIVELVERHFFSAPKERKREILRPAVEYFRTCGIDQLILACTHFLFLEEDLAAMLGPGVSLVDSRDGVARQTRRILQNEGLANVGPNSGRRGGEPKASGADGAHGADGADGTDETEGFHVTGPVPGDTYRRFAEMYGLQWREEL
jgi:glutamate racemase